MDQPIAEEALKRLVFRRMIIPDAGART